ncbi:MAG TPA: hypothetical protein VK140_09030 [Ktedonobacteraceae bacterium]|nr:hypothetical protein [Ktedonobacteraceae bacterium]
MIRQGPRIFWIAAGSSPTGSSSWNPASISIAQFVLKKITIA